MSGPPGFSYTPAPHERAFYGALFQAADSERSGSIGGANAVAFFTRSKLPTEQLKHIWVAADQPPTNALNHLKFAVAIRLIQLEQNGVKPTGPDLAVGVPPNLRPPYFEGIQPGGGPPPQPNHNHSPTPSVAQSSTSPHTYRPAPPPQQQQPMAAMGGPNPQRSQPPPPPAGPASSVASHPSGAGVQQQQHQLAVQDPYSLTPQEQARYEQLFPDYAKDAQYMYGPEAVALFSKSGLPQTQLGQIWNMVDVPVDNRLDKLEFSMAMHLIVCVSKKNLPMPRALPLSMKQLKEYQRQQLQSQHQQMSLTNDSAHHPPSVIQAPREVPQQQGAGLSPRLTPAAAAAPQQQNKSSLPGPPPQGGGVGGGLSISDAFEGLGPPGDTGSIASFSRTNQTAYESSQQQPSYSYQQHNIPPTVVETVEEEAPMSPILETAKKRVVALSGPSISSPSNQAKSYDLGESTVELEKLRSALQKLQAENISLKARLGSMTEEEKDIQKELGATISEITKLSGDLTTLRAQVLASKSRLLEATAELKSAKEKKGMIQDLIAETTATKQAMDEAYDGLEKANEQSKSLSAPTPMMTPEADLFSWGSPELPTATTSKTQSNGYSQHLASSQEEGEEEQQSIEQQQTMPASATVSFAQPPPQTTINPPHQQQRQAPVFTFNQSLKTPGSYDGGGYNHNRHASGASGFGEVMGGSADLQSLAESMDALPNTPSMKEIDDLKSQSREADAVARDAEANHRHLVAQMTELRRLADEAENKARALSEKPTKKKGMFSSGKGKKVDAKELERTSADARKMKESLLQVQAQVKDAEALAFLTRQEAEKLQKRAEDAQVEAATAASMQQYPPASGNPTPPMQSSTLGGPSGPSQNQYAVPPNPYLASPPVNPSNSYPEYGFAQQSTGFDSNVMSNSGGFSIPTPQNDDLYGNPFSS